jgi:hypothetical protein
MLLRLRLYLRILKSKAFADHFIQIADGAQVRLGTRQKRLDADVHRKTALDAAGDDTLDGAVVVVGRFLMASQTLTLAAFSLDRMTRSSSSSHHSTMTSTFVARLALIWPFSSMEFVDADLAFGFVADVHQHVSLSTEMIRR